MGGLDDERLREIYGHENLPPPQDFVDGLVDKMPVPDPGPEPEPAASRAPVRRNATHGRQEAERQRKGEVPLGELLMKYISVAARDGKNLAILSLSAIVLFMSFRGFSSAPQPGSASLQQMPLANAINTPLTTAVEEPVTKALSQASESVSSVLPFAETSLPVKEDESKQGDEEGEAESEGDIPWTETAESVMQEILVD